MGDDVLEREKQVLAFDRPWTDLLASTDLGSLIAALG